MKTKTKSLEQLIKSHNFNYINSNITSDLFPPQDIRGEIEILHFPNEFLTSEEIIKRGAEKGLTPANIYELLSWEGWNGKDWVVALGSVGEVDGCRYVPYLYRYGSRRDLYLYWFDGRWGADCRSAFVRKSSLASDSQDSFESKPLALPQILTINGIKYKRDE